jgi:hypothetical protein
LACGECLGSGSSILRGFELYSNLFNLFVCKINSRVTNLLGKCLKARGSRSRFLCLLQRIGFQRSTEVYKTLRLWLNERCKGVNV